MVNAGTFRKTVSYRVTAGLVLASFVLSLVTPPRALAQAFNLPAPGSMVMGSPVFMPVMARGLKVHPENPLLFDFIVDAGDSGFAVEGPQFKAESEKLIKYFLASLTVKDDDQWVNLSPYEKDRMIPDDLGKTELGRDMLAQDYMLKQLTASLVYPEKGLGKAFWSKIYEKAQAQFGTIDIPVDTFNKVWITADKAKVLERNNTAYVVGAHLKVMLESDYVAAEASGARRGGSQTRPSDVIASNSTQDLAQQVLREVIIPQIEAEVNAGQNFTQLRQIFYAMILSTWYKRALKDALLNQVYSNKSKTNGVENADPAVKEKIYQQYLEAYRKGVFNYIKEESVPNGDTIPRKYFSGGIAKNLNIKNAMVVDHSEQSLPVTGLQATVLTVLDPEMMNSAVLGRLSHDTMSPRLAVLKEHGFSLIEVKAAVRAVSASLRQLMTISSKESSDSPRLGIVMLQPGIEDLPSKAEIIKVLFDLEEVQTAVSEESGMILFNPRFSSDGPYLNDFFWNLKGIAFDYKAFLWFQGNDSALSGKISKEAAEILQGIESYARNGDHYIPWQQWRTDVLQWYSVRVAQMLAQEGIGEDPEALALLKAGVSRKNGSSLWITSTKDGVNLGKVVVAIGLLNPLDGKMHQGMANLVEHIIAEEVRAGVVEKAYIKPEFQSYGSVQQVDLKKLQRELYRVLLAHHRARTEEPDQLERKIAAVIRASGVEEEIVRAIKSSRQDDPSYLKYSIIKRVMDKIVPVVSIVPEDTRLSIRGNGYGDNKVDPLIKYYGTQMLQRLKSFIRTNRELISKKKFPHFQIKLMAQRPSDTDEIRVIFKPVDAAERIEVKKLSPKIMRQRIDRLIENGVKLEEIQAALEAVAGILKSRMSASSSHLGHGGIFIFGSFKHNASRMKEIVKFLFRLEGMGIFSSPQNYVLLSASGFSSDLNYVTDVYWYLKELLSLYKETISSRRKALSMVPAATDQPDQGVQQAVSWSFKNLLSDHVQEEIKRVLFNSDVTDDELKTLSRDVRAFVNHLPLIKKQDFWFEVLDLLLRNYALARQAGLSDRARVLVFLNEFGIKKMAWIPLMVRQDLYVQYLKRTLVSKILSLPSAVPEKRKMPEVLGGGDLMSAFFMLVDIILDPDDVSPRAAAGAVEIRKLLSQAAQLKRDDKRAMLQDLLTLAWDVLEVSQFDQEISKMSAARFFLQTLTGGFLTEAELIRFNRKPAPLGIKILDLVDLVMKQMDDAQRTPFTQAVDGGIDINGKNLNLDVAREGQGIEMKLNPVMVAQFQRGDFSGVVPVILKVTPIASPLPLLGLR